MVNKKDLRGGIEKMREVAQLLTGWADDLERSLEAGKKKKPAAAADAAPAVETAPVAETVPAEPAPAPAPAADAVRAELAAKCAAVEQRDDPQCHWQCA